MFNVYEETIHVPLIISHPDLPNKGTTNSLASLVDILPTVASLANVPNKAAWTHSGVDLTPIINDPTAALQDTILFTFDDDRAGTGSDPGFLTSTPIAHHIRCIRCDYNGKQWKYARYFNPADEEAAAEEFELYCLTDDPLEQDNLYSPTTPSAEQTHLQDRLAQVEAERLKPLGITYLPVFQK
jgi:arylsulfatase A-like enzyme